MGAGSEGCHPRLMPGTQSGVRLGLGGRKHNDAKAAKAAKAQRINPSVDPTGFTDRPVLPKKSANDPRIGAVPAGTPEDSRVAQAPGPPATPTQPFSPAPEGQRIRPAGAHRGDEMDAGSGGCHPRLMSGTPSGVRWGLCRRKSRSRAAQAPGNAAIIGSAFLSDPRYPRYPRSEFSWDLTADSADGADEETRSLAVEPLSPEDSNRECCAAPLPTCLVGLKSPVQPLTVTSKL
jgi:hypothetical protein